MNIAPGWYGVSGTSDVRWWDGAKFRPILLRDGLPHYEKFRSISPVPSIVLGVLMALLGIGRFGISDDDPYAFALGIAWVLIGVMSLVLGLLGLVIERLPAPIHGPYLDPRTFPWPEQVEYGPIPPGWYPAPSKRIPRWWSGARWSEYVVLRRFPLPMAGQRKRQIATTWTVAIAFILLAGVGVALAFYGARLHDTSTMVVGVTLAVSFLLLGGILTAYMAYLVRVYTLPVVLPGVTR